MPNLADLEVPGQGLEEVGDQRDSLGEGEIDDFDFVPIRKGPVRNDEGIGVANAGEEVVDGWIQNSFLEHGWGEFVRPI